MVDHHSLRLRRRPIAHLEPVCGETGIDRPKAGLSFSRVLRASVLLREAGRNAGRFPKGLERHASSFLRLSAFSLDSSTGNERQSREPRSRQQYVPLRCHIPVGCPLIDPCSPMGPRGLRTPLPQHVPRHSNGASFMDKQMAIILGRNRRIRFICYNYGREC